MLLVLKLLLVLGNGVFVLILFLIRADFYGSFDRRSLCCSLEVSSIVAGGTILAGFLTQRHPTFKVLTFCFICPLIVVIVDFYNLSGCLVEPRKMFLTPSQ